MLSSGFEVDDNYYDHCRSEFQEPWKNPSEEGPAELIDHVTSNVLRNLTVSSIINPYFSSALCTYKRIFDRLVRIPSDKLSDVSST